ncbi:MgtC/SapB family protein [Aggregatibacter actinomycetemcomitans]|uniref:MgtC/SapB family protein n=1 Tax=Aggregatibacter actinomycetemcomitans TaxID=714 RepID=UPI0011D590DE|nr:MgtC/SapB family protein [Aggregatibacter actinomycetemcomitans]QEH45130.1 MgtC/SapB family protein [Aggregatibacter actinomycetemcomitans]TYA50322.1 MgtC/SapB family protein [Aggregatibacter actinomycetemcomitans]TYB26935.1 MgtC/SapB family protein [Aggregatibacter actinomycetemcomitans]
MNNLLNFIEASARDSHFFIFAKMAFAMILGGIIGLERELKAKPVGVKTCMIIAVTTCVLTIVSIQSAEHYAQVSENIRTDPMRLAAQVISGIGFLGAGVILRKHNDAISGLTTAAIIWAAAGIGIASGAGFYFDAMVATIMILIAIRLSPYVHNWVRHRDKKKKTRINATLLSPNAIAQFVQLLHNNNHSIENINVKDQPNGETKLTIRCSINDKATIQELYLLLKNDPNVASLELEN